MSVTDFTIKHILFINWFLSDPQSSEKTFKKEGFDLWKPLRNWLNKIEISDRRIANRICKLIPSQCPFARQIKLFGHTLFTIPPLCKINPVYDELMMLRFRALCYLEGE